jgi:hypothetical protein
VAAFDTGLARLLPNVQQAETLPHAPRSVTQAMTIQLFALARLGSALTALAAMALRLALRLARQLFRRRERERLVCRRVMQEAQSMLLARVFAAAAGGRCV